MISLVAVDGGWSEWSQFFPCSKTCGGGSITRFRNCNNPSPVDGGKDCPGAYFESQDCNSGPCKSHKQISGFLKTHLSSGPVNGRWSRWSSWSACSVVCGGPGVQLRRRECSNPPPSNGGANCTGKMVRDRDCNTGPCPNGNNSL